MAAEQFYKDGPVWSARESVFLDDCTADELRSMVRHLTTSPDRSPKVRLRAAVWHVVRRRLARAGGGAV